MLRLHHGNRIERLAADLFERLLEPSPSPLEPEWVVVPQPGMARWLSLGLARQRGIAANVRYPLPGAFIWHLVRAVVPQVPERSRFEPSVLKWRVLATLGDLSPAAAELQHYLAGADERMRYELAERIAGCFDQYLVYRPDWIRAWEGGEGQHWQAQLWRRLSQDRDPMRGRGHWVALCDAFLTALTAGPAGAGALPARAFLFAVTSLSPAYVELLAAVSEHMEIHVYVLDPCREYWGDIVTPREVARRGIAEPERLYFTRGNPLLASLGRVGRELIDQLQGAGSESDDHYLEAPGDTLLARLQNDILDLRDRTAPASRRAPLAPGDRSVQVHVCHSPVREMEVLHDQLLALLESGELDPSDVTVLTPSIEAYAPAIEAVFGSAPPERRIPYAVADRQPASESPLAAAFFKLLDLPARRFPADEVFGLLSQAAVRRRFRIDEAALPRLRGWIEAAGIRWGADAADRARLGLPETEEFTWRHGLDRLLLGLAMQGEHRRAFAGLHPVDGVDGGDAELLGRFVEFCERAFALAAVVERPHRAPEWAALLAGLVAEFFEVRDAEGAEAHLLLGAAAGLAEDCEVAGYRQAIGVDVVRAHLLGALPRLAAAGGQLLSGRLTFCEMVPMRSIPSEVVCLVGMNDGAYPRRAARLGFDRLARDRRRGDRDRRDDDRYLFLESLLSARRCFYVSYTGVDPREDAPLPPSPLVSELLDLIDQGFEGSAGDGGAAACVTTRHPLQPFSPRYFEPGSELFSYDAASARAAAVLTGLAPDPPSRRRAVRPAAPERFFEAPLPEAGAEWRVAEAADFVRFFEHPVRYLVRQRLGVRLGAADAVLGEPEPFALGGLERYWLRQNQEPLGRARPPVDEVLAIARGDARLPAGAMGEVELAAALAAVGRFQDRLEAAGAGAWPAPAGGEERIEVDLTLALPGGRGRLRVTGALDGTCHPDRPAQLISARLGNTRPRDLVTAWVRHLLASADPGADRDPVQSSLVFLDAVHHLAPAADPLRHLNALAAAYWDGLHAPSRLLPAAGLAYARGEGEGGRRLAAARRCWHPGGDPRRALRGESVDPYYALAFGVIDPLDEEFVTLSETLLRPLVDHLEAAGTAAGARS